MFSFIYSSSTGIIRTHKMTSSQWLDNSVSKSIAPASQVFSLFTTALVVKSFTAMIYLRNEIISSS